MEVIRQEHDVDVVDREYGNKYGEFVEASMRNQWKE
jgi:hypothetical protein